MIHLHVFTEERSAKIVFDAILPKILPDGITFSIYPHQGKQDLEKAIKLTLPSISKIPGARILITRDQDSGDCKVIKENIKSLIHDNCRAPYLIRIVCRDLESWFLGDLLAIGKAYKRFKPEQYLNKEEFRNVDNNQNSSSILLSIIPEYKKHDTLPKLEASENISNHLNIKVNNSTSFNFTIQGILKLIND